MSETDGAMAAVSMLCTVGNIVQISCYMGAKILSQNMGTMVQNAFLGFKR